MMSDQEVKEMSGVLPGSEVGPNGGGDAEGDKEMPEGKGVDNMDSHPYGKGEGRGSSGESPRKHKSNSERRHRYHHHSSGSSSHHRRRRSGGHSGEDSEALEDSGRSHRRSDSIGDDHSSTSHRRSTERRSSRSQRSRRRTESSRDDSLQDEETENPVASSHTKKMDKDMKVDAEAEDGEILEDGELDDDDGNDDGSGLPQPDSRGLLDTSHEDIEASPSKSYNKEDGNKSSKRDRKKQEHRDKRRRDDDKKKRKKYMDMDQMPQEESEPAPAWGSGYQGGRAKTSPLRAPSRSPPFGGKAGKGSPPFGGKAGKGSRGGKGYQSPPGLYDSPSYSEDSEDDQYPRSFNMLSGGYLDASVAADEKEGIFKRGVIFKKKKRPDRNQPPGMGKRRGPDFGKVDGPPKKKALIDMAMSDRPKCKFYRDGKCAKGSGCPFNHDMEQPKRFEVCKYHLTHKGCHKERCLYMHDFPCKYYHTGAQCFSGDRCKFSHDPLTQETRRALEMRVAPEDIIYMDDPDEDSDYEYQARNYESRSRPSLLGSPPRRHDVKKIPSLFDIEVHPPAPSAKPSPSSIRPTGFYSEAGSSPPNPGNNAGNPQGPPPPPPPSSGGGGGGVGGGGNNINNNNNNMNSGNMNSSNDNNMNMGMRPGGPPMPGSANQGGGPGLMRPNMANTMAGQGLLQTPNMLPGAGPGPMGPMMGGPMAGNRPPLMGNQPMRPGMPFMNNNNNNNNNNNANNNPPSNNLPPVLNMLGAIIREAAMQKVSSAAPNMNMSGPNMNMSGPNMNMSGPNMNMSGPNMNNMGGMNMVQNNMSNMAPNSMPTMVQNNVNSLGVNALNARGANNMGQGNMNNMGQANMNRMMPPGMNQMGPNNMNQMGPGGMNAMGGNNMNPTMPGTANPSLLQGQANCDGAMVPRDRPDESSGKQEDMMDVDYRIKQNFEDNDETSKDLSELDSLRRHLQEQINQEDAKEEDEEEEEAEESRASDQEASQDGKQSQPKEERSISLEKDSSDESGQKLSSKSVSESSLENIEVPAHLPKKQRELFMRIQQQHILREREKERQEALKAAEEVETTVDKDDWYSSSDEDEDDKTKSTELKDSSLKLSAQQTSKASDSSSKTPATSVPTTFNIMQMINAIRSQGTTSAAEAKTETLTVQKLDSALQTDPYRPGHTVETKSPASPPASPGETPSGRASFPVSSHAVEPPVISATPSKPLKYAVVRITLHMPKTYTLIPEDVDPSDPAYRFDPRVKRHLQLTDRPLQPAPTTPREKEVRRASVDSADKSAKLVDPRLKRAPTDPRLAKIGGGSPSGRPDEGRPADPRLKKDSLPSRPVDPRLAKRAASVNNDPRLNRQVSQEPGSQVMNTMGSPLGGSNNSMGNMNMGGPMNNVGGPMNNRGGPMNSMGVGPMNNMGGPMGNMGGAMGNMGGAINSMGGPMNKMGGAMNSMGGPMNNMGGPMNNMGGLMSNLNSQMSGMMNNLNGPVRPMNRMGGPMNSMGMPLNNMGGPMNSMAAGRMSSPIGANSQANMMGPRGPTLLGGPTTRMGGPRAMSNPMSNQMGGSNEQLQGNFPENTNDPRLNQRPLSDPRLNDPRLQSKSQDMQQDQGMNRNDPRLMSGSQMGWTMKVSDGGNDPRLSNDPPRSMEFSHGGPDDPRGFSDRRSPNLSDVSKEKSPFPFRPNKAVMDPLPSLSSSASLPPLPSLSPPPSLSSYSASSDLSDIQSSPKDASSETQKSSKKFDYRNDPRFRRVKRTTAARQSSMEYSSPLGGEDGDAQMAQDLSGPSPYNSYNRPKPADSDSPHRPSAPSPSLPDTLQDFDMPEAPANEPDLKVKDLFKAIDPTASPFC